MGSEEVIIKKQLGTRGIVFSRKDFDEVFHFITVQSTTFTNYSGV